MGDIDIDEEQGERIGNIGTTQRKPESGENVLDTKEVLQNGREDQMSEEHEDEFRNEHASLLTERCCDLVSCLWKLPIVVFEFFRAHPLTFVELLTWFVYYCVGILFYSNTEGWTFIECLYFITVSFSTIGYGQFAPTSQGSKIFTCFYCVFGIFFVLTAINRVATRWLIKLQKPTLDFLLGRKYHSPSTKIFFSCAVILFLIFLGMLLFSALEGWAYSDSFYWVIISMTTVGYGDMLVSNEGTLMFGILFIYSCMLIYSLMLTNIEHSMLKIRVEKRRSDMLNNIRNTGVFVQHTQPANLNSFLREGDCSLFVVTCLLRMGKLHMEEDIESIINFYMQEKDSLSLPRRRSSSMSANMANTRPETAHEGDADYETWGDEHDSMLLESIDKYLSMKQQRDYVDKARASSRHGEDNVDRFVAMRPGSIRPFSDPIPGRMPTANPLQKEVSLDSSNDDSEEL